PERPVPRVLVLRPRVPRAAARAAEPDLLRGAARPDRNDVARGRVAPPRPDVGRDRVIDAEHRAAALLQPESALARSDVEVSADRFGRDRARAVRLVLPGLRPGLRGPGQRVAAVRGPRP